MKEISYEKMKFNPFNLIGGEWMLVSAGSEQSGCNTMTASWGHLGCLWGHNDPTAVIYIRPSRYTKEFLDKETHFTLCVMEEAFKKQIESRYAVIDISGGNSICMAVFNQPCD